MSLDFTSFVPAPATSSPAPPTAVEAPAAAPEAPSPETVPPTPAPAPPKAEVATPKPPRPPLDPPAPPASAIKSASLAGTLNARVRDPLVQVLALTARTPIRLDLARIVDADDDGALLLTKALTAARRAGRPLHLAGAGHLAALLSARVAPGERSHEGFWLLLAELRLWLGRQAEFEETAIGYAVAFEVSPPSWETPPADRCEN